MARLDRSETPLKPTPRPAPKPQTSTAGAHPQPTPIITDYASL